MSPVLGCVRRTIRSVYYTVHHYGIGLHMVLCDTAKGRLSFCRCRMCQRARFGRFICGSSIVGQIGKMYRFMLIIFITRASSVLTRIHAVAMNKGWEAKLHEA